MQAAGTSGNRLSLGGAGFPRSAPDRSAYVPVRLNPDTASLETKVIFLGRFQALLDRI
jgi:hypothetical protein